MDNLMDNLIMAHKSNHVFTITFNHTNKKCAALNNISMCVQIKTNENTNCYCV